MGFVILVLLIYGCANGTKSKKIEKIHSTSQLTVTVKSPQKQKITQHIDVTGSVIPKQESIVTTELSGVRVRQIYSDIGDTVKKG